MKENIEYFQIPNEHAAFVRKRVGGLMRHWGRFCDSQALEVLAMSCYTQGLQDMQQLQITQEYGPCLRKE